MSIQKESSDAAKDLVSVALTVGAAQNIAEGIQENNKGKIATGVVQVGVALAAKMSKNQ